MQVSFNCQKRNSYSFAMKKAKTKVHRHKSSVIKPGGKPKPSHNLPPEKSVNLQSHTESIWSKIWEILHRWTIAEKIFHSIGKYSQVAFVEMSILQALLNSYAHESLGWTILRMLVMFILRRIITHT